jgi:hypothetical protein
LLRRGLFAAVCALAAFVALFPFSGDDEQPPTHYSVFGYEVPGGIWPPLVAAVVVGALVWAVTRTRRG